MTVISRQLGKPVPDKLQCSRFPWGTRTHMYKFPLLWGEDTTSKERHIKLLGTFFYYLFIAPEKKQNFS